MARLLGLPLLLALFALSCSTGNPATTPGPHPETDDQARVRVENRASIDMDIYLLRSDGQAMRLGFVAGGDTSTFALPATLTAGANSIRFQARPVRRSGEPFTSEPFGISSGGEISWSIPPQ